MWEEIFILFLKEVTWLEQGRNEHALKPKKEKI